MAAVFSYYQIHRPLFEPDFLFFTFPIPLCPMTVFFQGVTGDSQRKKNTGFQLDELFSNNSSYTFWLAFKEYTRNISVAVGMYLVQNTALN